MHRNWIPKNSILWFRLNVNVHKWIAISVEMAADCWIACCAILNTRSMLYVLLHRTAYMICLWKLYRGIFFSGEVDTTEEKLMVWNRKGGNQLQTTLLKCIWWLNWIWYACVGLLAFIDAISKIKGIMKVDAIHFSCDTFGFPFISPVKTRICRHDINVPLWNIYG